MSEAAMYYHVKPKRKWIKTTITRIALLSLGQAFQTAYRVDPTVKKEVDSWPPTFSFVMEIEPNGPRMVIIKRNGGISYLGEKEMFDADVVLCVKNIEYGFRMMTGFMSTPRITFENRQYVKGDLARLSSIVRCLNICQLMMLPNFIARFYIKKVPPLSRQIIKNRIIFYTVGVLGMVK